MAQTISQRIALEGGEEIQRQFEAMRAAGVKTFAEIDKAALDAAQTLGRFVAAVARVEQSFSRVQSSAVAFGAAVTGAARGFTQFESALSRGVRNVALFTAGIAAGNLGILKFVKDAANAADEVDEQAQGLGTTAEKLQAFRAAAATAGVSAEQFARGVSFFNKILVQDSAKALEDAKAKLRELGVSFAPTEEGAKGAGAAMARLTAEAAKMAQLSVVRQGITFKFSDTEEGRKAAAELRTALGQVSTEADKAQNALRRLGVSSLDLTGKTKDPLDAILELSDAFSKLPEGAEKARLAAELTGTLVGRRFVTFLNLGSEGIKELTKQFAALNFTQAQIKTGSQFADALDLLSHTATQARRQLGLLFAPSLTQLANAFTKSILNNFAGLSTSLQNFVKTKFEPIVRDIAKLLGPDLFNPALGTQGGPADQRLESGIFGGSLTEARNNLLAFKTAVVETGKAVGAVFSAIVRAADTVAPAINAIFGTNFSGATLIATAAVLKFLGVFGLFVAALRLAGGVLVAFTRGLVLLVAAFRGLAAVGGLLRFIPILLAGLNPVALAAALAAIVALFLLNRDKIVELWTQVEPELRKAGTKIIGELKKIFGFRPDDTAFSFVKRAFEEAFTFDPKILEQNLASASAFFKRAFDEAFTFDQGKLEENLRAIGDIISRGVEFSLDWITAKFVSAFDAVKSQAAAFVEFLRQTFSRLPLFGGLFSAAGGLQQLFSQPTAPAAAAPGATSPGLSQLDAQAAQTATTLQGLNAAGGQAATSLQGVGSQVGTVLTTALQQLATDFQAATQGLDTASTEADQVAQSFNPLSNAAQVLADAFERAARGLDSGGGFARGGRVSGPGTTTSDSILARLSRGEFVVNAKATNRYLPLLHAINAMKFRMPKFNMGGLVGGFTAGMQASLSHLAMPQFAEGGLALAGGGKVAIDLDLRTDGGRVRGRVFGGQAMADALEQLSVSRQLSSGGRKSSAYR